MDLHEALKSYFGYEEFRPYQEEIVRRILEGRSTLGVLPTGAGKSLCYQLPALLLPRPTLVISPLVALMQDQLDGLPPEVYPKAALINSSLAPDEIERRLGEIEAGRYRLIYAAPERLRQGGFLRLLARVGLSLVVVDEAHCVSVWGHDFRPDYLFIRKALEALSPPVPESPSGSTDQEVSSTSLVYPGNGDSNPDRLIRPNFYSPLRTDAPPTLLALTATATAEMRAEIAAQLGRPLETIAASTFRPNLRLEVIRCANADDKMRRLEAVCRETPGATIIYAGSRERCEKLAAFLRSRSLSAAHYHAGLGREERRATQERFMLGRIPIIVATVAFGMGVDKSNVRLVAHFSLPASLEAYTQEAGRAGRDGRASRCVLLYAPGDKSSLSRRLHQDELRLEVVRDVYRALQSRLGRGSGTVSPDDLQREVFGEDPDPDDDSRSGSSGAGAPMRPGGEDPRARLAGEDSRLRVAISALERCGLLARHPDAGRDMRIEMQPPPRSSRAELEALLEWRRRHAETRLERMVAYAEGKGCRHAAIARHFDQELPPCGASCDCCLGTVETDAPERPSAPTADQVPDIGRMILQTSLALPFAMGRTGLVKTLVGAADGAVKKDRCELYGCLAGFSASSLERTIERMVEDGLLSRDLNDEYRRLSVTEAGKEALQSEQTIVQNPNRTIPVRRDRTAVTARSLDRTASALSGIPQSNDMAPDEEEDDRFERLRAWRRIEASRAGVPPYVVFHDATLRALARANPRTLQEMETIPGIGPRKLESHGAAVLALLHDACDTDGASGSQ